MDNICVNVYHCDFDRHGPLVLSLYGDVIIFLGCLEQLMMWCLKILAYEGDKKDVARLPMVQDYVPLHS
jgi:hypothetical protein